MCVRVCVCVLRACVNLCRESEINMCSVCVCVCVCVMCVADSIEWTSQFLHGYCEEEEELSPSPCVCV